VQREGLERVSKCIKFKNLIFFKFDFDSIQIISYKKTSSGVLKVLAEKKEIPLDDVIKTQEFSRAVNDFGYDDFGQSSFAVNNLFAPVYNCSSYNSVLTDYLATVLRLAHFMDCRKLDFKDYGQGSIRENLLVLSGSHLRQNRNIQLFLLAILSTFDIHGHFTVCMDRFGFFDMLQRERIPVLPEKTLIQILLEFWGSVIVIDSKKKALLDEVVAKVDVKDGDIERQVIPMFGKILNFTFLEKGDFDIELQEKFHIYKARGKSIYSDMTGNLVIDARSKPLSDNFRMYDKKDLMNSWLKGIGAIP
jgi:hypothetical protein